MDIDHFFSDWSDLPIYLCDKNKHIEVLKRFSYFKFIKWRFSEGKKFENFTLLHNDSDASFAFNHESRHIKNTSNKCLYKILIKGKHTHTTWPMSNWLSSSSSLLLWCLSTFFRSVLLMLSLYICWLCSFWHVHCNTLFTIEAGR